MGSISTDANQYLCLSTRARAIQIDDQELSSRISIHIVNVNHQAFYT